MRLSPLHKLLLAAVLVFGQWLAIAHDYQHPALGGDETCQVCLHGPNFQAGPTTGWEAPSRFGPVGRSYRYLLQRLLRPYLVRQREFDRAVAAGLEEAEAVARHHRDEIARLRQAITALERKHERIGHTQADRRSDVISGDRAEARDDP